MTSTPLAFVALFRRRPRFLQLWVGMLISALGDTVSWLALPWYILERSERGDLVGALLLSFALPAVVTGPLWGRAMDRLQPKWLMVADNIARACILGLVPLFSIFNALDLWMVFAVAILAGALAPASQIGVRLLIPALLDDHELELGNAAYGLTIQISIVFGPALAGALIVGWGVAQAILIDALSFLLLAAMLFNMPLLPRAGHASDQTPKTMPLRGWSPAVLAILGLTGLFYFSYGPLEVALPVFAQQQLDANALGYSSLWTALGIGTLIGTLLVGVLGRLPRTLVLTAIMALWGVIVIMLAQTNNTWVAMAIMLVGGIIWGPYTALETTQLQRLVDPEAHGRLFGVRSMLLGPAAPLGTALGGLMLVGLDTSLVITLSGVACVVGAAIAWVWIRNLH